MILDNMKKNMKKVAGGITAVSGFEAAGLGCGLKKNGSKDLALIYSRKPAAAAGVFTRNKYKAPPLILTQKNISNPVQAVIINSGMLTPAPVSGGCGRERNGQNDGERKLGLQKKRFW